MSDFPISHTGFTNWFHRAPWRILVTGLILAVAITLLLMRGIMHASMSELVTLATTLTITSLLSLGLGYLLYRRGWARSPSLNVTLVTAYVWAALLTLFNVWVMAEQMFASEHDLSLAGVLLLFAGIIAITFGVFVAANVSDTLGQLVEATRRIAAGDLQTRAMVRGRDEVAQMAQAFNEMAEELQKTADQRRELDLLRRDLIAWTSHDLRTPLTSIRAMVEALHDGVVTDGEMVQRYYRTIRADVIALNGLIDDLFEMAQLEANGLKLEKFPHSLSDLISDSLESFRAVADQRSIHLTGDVSPQIDPVCLNAAKIGRVLANLLSNALRYTPEGGQVHVSAVRVAEGVQVMVQDSGAGFSPQDLPRIFEQFYRGEVARSRATGGAGLGLAIARGVVEGHNGRIWAENAPGGGAVVAFILPK